LKKEGCTGELVFEANMNKGQGGTAKVSNQTREKKDPNRLKIDKGGWALPERGCLHSIREKKRRKGGGENLRNLAEETGATGRG